MSKMAVGTISRPAMSPHRIDCGFRKTVPSPWIAAGSQSSCRAAGSGFGISR